MTDGLPAARDAHPSRPAGSPLDAFVGNPVLPRANPPYRAALAAVAAVMVMLPVVYLGMLGVVAWAVWWHAWHDTWIIHGWVGAFLYFGPIVAGLVLAFFMSKPFFAGTPPGPPRFTVDDRAEPLLTAFVARLCGELHAPRPVRIDLDDFNLVGRLSELQWQSMSRLAEMAEAAVAGVSPKGPEVLR